MSANVLDGKGLAATIQDEIRDRVAEFIKEELTVPCLAAVLVGENAASEVYVRNKRLEASAPASRVDYTDYRLMCRKIICWH